MFATAARLSKRAVAPAESLLGRLRYAQKFVLIGVVLIAPLGWVVKSYIGAQNRDTAFAVKERVGVVYLRPATALLERVVAARSAAVQVAAHKADPSALTAARAGVNAAIAGVNAARDAGATLGLNGQWTRLRGQIETVVGAPVTTPTKALADYNGLTAGIEGLIAADGNNSNMILDPDNDAYYVMDAVLNRITVLMDSAGLAGDMQMAIVAEGQPTLAKRLTLEDLKGTIATTLSNSDPDYASALHNTHYSGMHHALAGPLASLDASLAAVTAQLSSAVSGTLDGAAATRLGTIARARAMALDGASLPVIDHLLAVRIGGFNAAAHQTEAIALIAVLFAIYLFIGFYLSVKRSQQGILEGLVGLKRGCTDPLAEGLDSMATGDLTRRIEADSPVVEQTTKDELGTVAGAVNDIRDHVISSISSFNVMSDQLRTMLGDVSESAGRIHTASQEMSETSEEAGKATGDIARAVGDVAQGAERQVGMIGVARQIAEEVARAAGDSADGARQTAEVAVEARHAVGEGASAATKASEAMGSVRDSSSAVTTAIGELAAKSEQIGTIVQTITDIAEQTNLLALNAAIEAARAGEQGKGFAVVAEEVRRLAESSQNAAAEIGGLIGAIQAETARTVEVVQNGARLTEEGTEVVAQTRDAFERIGASVDDMTSRVEQIAAASQQIAASADRMQQSISEIASVAEESSASSEEVSASTQETSASTEQIAASAQELASTAGTLEALVGRFRLSATVEDPSATAES